MLFAVYLADIATLLSLNRKFFRELLTDASPEFQTTLLVERRKLRLERCSQLKNLPLGYRVAVYIDLFFGAVLDKKSSRFSRQKFPRQC